MGSNFNLNTNKLPQNPLPDHNTGICGGGVKKENIDQKFYSIFDKVDRDKNGILDDAELANFRAEIDANKDGNIDKKESKNYIKNNNLSFTNDKGKQKELSSEDLNQFLDSLALNVDKAEIKSATKGEVEGKSAVTITKNDGSQEIIFDDKNEPTRLVKTDPQTGETKTQFVKDGKVLKEEVENQNGDKTITEFGDDGKPIQSTTVKKGNGETSVTNYTDGVPASKDVKKGTTQKHYSIDQSGNEILETEVQDMGCGLKKTSTHTYEDNTETITTTNPDGSEIVETKVDGKLTQNVETKAGGTITTKFNDDGSKIEIKEKNNVTTTTSLNAEGHRTEQTQIVNGQTYEVKYDGNGNTKIVVRAGDSLEQIADYMTRNSGQKVTVEDLKKLNPKVTNDNIQAGQLVLVPGEFDAASGIVLSRGTQAEQKAKGDAAEIKLNESVGSLNETYVIENAKGKYNSYEDCARDLLSQEGLSAKNEQLVKKLAKEIATMNGNKPINVLDNIYAPASVQHKSEIDEQNKKLVEEKAKQAELKQAKANFEVMHNAYIEARIEFNNHKNKENFTHWAADGISKAWNNRFINLTGNTEKQVREELDAYGRAYSRMADALEAGNMEEFKHWYKDTFHKDYDGSLPDNMNKINERVTDYNDSQETGGAVVEGTLKGAGAVMGGAGGAALASVIVDGAKDLTTGVRDGYGNYNANKVIKNAEDIYEHAGEKVVEYGINAGLSAGATKLGQAAGEYIGGKIGQGLASKIKIGDEHVLVGNLNNSEGMLVLSEEGTQILKQGLKYSGIGSGAGRYVADNVASDVVSGSKDVIEKGIISPESAAGGIIADASIEGSKKLGQRIGKLLD